MTSVVRRWTATLLAAAAVVGVGVAAYRLRPVAEDPTWRPGFAQERALVANEHDVTSAADRLPRSPDWIVTSGSLFSDGGAGWSGRIDGRSPDERSRRSTGSAVLRVVSQPEFGGCSMTFELRLDGMTSTERTPARDYDGVHVFLRYRDAWNLYAVSVARRDHEVVVKKKTGRGVGSGDEEGEYSTLATSVHRLTRDVWHRVEVTVQDVPSGVRLTLAVDDRKLLDVVDEGVDGAAPLTGTGRVGLRGDNTEFHVRGIAVAPLG